MLFEIVVALKVTVQTLIPRVKGTVPLLVTSVRESATVFNSGPALILEKEQSFHRRSVKSSNFLANLMAVSFSTTVVYAI